VFFYYNATFKKVENLRIKPRLGVLFRVSVLSFDILHVQLFIQQRILGAMKISLTFSKMLEVAGKQKNASWEKVNVSSGCNL